MGMNKAVEKKQDKINDKQKEIELIHTISAIEKADEPCAQTVHEIPQGKR